MEKKEEKLYDIVFEFLNLKLKSKPKIFICDFEKAAITSFKKRLKIHE
jgi:hypothetical protein